MNPSSAPTLPTKLFYDKRPPFHDTVNLETNFDVIGLGAWYSEDYELISMVQLQPTGSSNGRLRQVHLRRNVPRDI